MNWPNTASKLSRKPVYRPHNLSLWILTISRDIPKTQKYNFIALQKFYNCPRANAQHYQFFFPTAATFWIVYILPGLTLSYPPCKWWFKMRLIGWLRLTLGKEVIMDNLLSNIYSGYINRVYAQYWFLVLNKIINHWLPQIFLIFVRMFHSNVILHHFPSRGGVCFPPSLCKLTLWFLLTNRRLWKWCSQSDVVGIPGLDLKKSYNYLSCLVGTLRPPCEVQMEDHMEQESLPSLPLQPESQTCEWEHFGPSSTN